jgi:hypothetical protein
MFGFASTLLSTWEVLTLYVMFPSNNKLLSPFSSSLGVAFVNGGTAGLFWNFLITTVGLSFLYASIAELGSMYVEL